MNVDRVFKMIFKKEQFEYEFLDSCGLIFNLQEKTLKTNVEQCAIGIAKKEYEERFSLIDYSFIQDFQGETHESFVQIPAKVSIALLSICQKNNFVPVIMHSHIIGYENATPLRFSQQDWKFMKTFRRTAQECGVSEVVFLLTNGSDIEIEI